MPHPLLPITGPLWGLRSSHASLGKAWATGSVTRTPKGGSMHLTQSRKCTSILCSIGRPGTWRPISHSVMLGLKVGIWLALKQNAKTARVCLCGDIWRSDVSLYCGFQGLDSGHQACLASEFTHYPSPTPFPSLFASVSRYGGILVCRGYFPYKVCSFPS